MEPFCPRCSTSLTSSLCPFVNTLFVRFSSESCRNQQGMVVGLARCGWTFPGRLVALYAGPSTLLKQHLCEPPTLSFRSDLFLSMIPSWCRYAYLRLSGEDRERIGQGGTRAASRPLMQLPFILSNQSGNTLYTPSSAAMVRRRAPDASWRLSSSRLEEGGLATPRPRPTQSPPNLLSPPAGEEA